MTSETIELDEQQRTKAEELLAQLDEGEIEKPEDIVEDWRSARELYDYDELVRSLIDDETIETERKTGYIPVSKIAGTTHSNAEIMDRRLRKALIRLLDGEFQVEHERPPKLEKFDDRYYVSVDGHHRVTAFKALEIEEMYIEYIEMPLEEL